MPTWKNFNEVGGTVILRLVSGAIALFGLYGFVTLAIRGEVSVYGLTILGLFVFVFGSYAVLGNGAQRVLDRIRFH
jgi:hypothetical protein